MNTQPFAIDPKYYGLPTLEELKAFRIWDSHYHGFLTGSAPIEQHHEMMYYVERMGIERIISVDIGGTLKDPLEPKPHDVEQLAILKNNSEKISGITPIDPGFPDESCEKMKEWIENGPCIGIKYVGGNKLGITCDEPRNDQIIQYAAELGAVIYIHTWIKIGGDPRRPAGGNVDGESTPMDVAVLAKRFPNVPLICGHAGGDWELAARAIRPYENVLFEFSGADPHSGSVDYAVKELGADRIVWGGHGPSRSYSTELSKVLDASLSTTDRMKIFGSNYRKMARTIFKTKGMRIEV
ncbi:MAG: amidohydrolase family protein [Cyclobacteriaceae bacterium]